MVFRKVCKKKKSSGQNPQVESLKSNVTEVNSIFFFFYSASSMPLYKFSSKCSCWFQGSIILYVWVTTATRVLMCSDTEFSAEEMVHSIKKAKLGLSSTCFDSVYKCPAVKLQLLTVRSLILACLQIFPGL